MVGTDSFAGPSQTLDLQSGHTLMTRARKYIVLVASCHSTREGGSKPEVTRNLPVYFFKPFIDT